LAAATDGCDAEKLDDETSMLVALLGSATINTYVLLRLPNQIEYEVAHSANFKTDDYVSDSTARPSKCNS
jgi:hypothetical protein